MSDSVVSNTAPSQQRSRVSKVDSVFVRRDYSHPRVVRRYSDAAESIGLWESERLLLNRYYGHQDRILDIGCGAGRATIGLYLDGFTLIVGIDLSSPMVVNAARIARQRSCSIPFVVGDGCALPFPCDSFDGALFSHNGLMQIPGLETRLAALREVRRVLTPGAVFVFTSPIRSSADPFWRKQDKTWRKGLQDPRLIEFGDVVLREDGWREGLLHFPTIDEILEGISTSGLRHVTHMRRRDICRERQSVGAVGGDDVFWVAVK
jgi:SAM-dependent methyltransferase